MNRGIFELAEDYDFDAVKRYIEQGGAVNICNEKGVSLIACFIEGYLMEAYHCDIVENRSKLTAYDENDEFWDSYIDEYQITPLEKRKHNIREELDYLLACGADLNLCKLVKGLTETPLFYALIYEDYYVLKYLLEHGADPGIWLSDEFDTADENDRDFWLLEHADVMILDGRRGAAKQNILNMAQLLWENGLNMWRGGICISVDENGIKR